MPSLLSTEGVVSVVGLGGVGKTRLAIQVAFDVLDRFPDGAWLVELAPSPTRRRSPGRLPRPPVSPRSRGGASTRSWSRRWPTRSPFWCWTAASTSSTPSRTLASRLSRHCPHLVILATSTEPLDIEGEVVWRVSPLPIVDPDGIDGAAEVAAADAVRLFVERARSVQPAVRAHRRERRRCRPHRGPGERDPAGDRAGRGGARSTARSAECSMGLTDRFSLADAWAADRTASPPDASRGVGVEPRPAPNRRTPPLRSTRRVRRRRDNRGDRRSLRRPPRRGRRRPPKPPPPGPRLVARSPRRVAGTLVDARVGPAAGRHRAGRRWAKTTRLAARHRTWFADRVERRRARRSAAAARPEVMRDLAADQDNVRRAIATADRGGRTTPSPFASAPRWRPFWTSHGDWTEGCEHLARSAGPARERRATAGTGPRCPGEPPAVAWGPGRGRGAPSPKDAGSPTDAG